MNSDSIDLRLTADGDIDFSLPVQGDELRCQLAYVRLKSTTTDYFHDHVGADVIELLGFPDDDNTRNELDKKIIHVLTFDGLCSQDEIYIKHNENDRNNLYFSVYIKNKYLAKGFRILNISIGRSFGINIKY